MLERRVHVRFREQAREVDRGIVLARVRERGLQHGILKERAVVDRHRDLRIILVDDLAGAEREVPHLAVADLAPREPDGDARCLQARDGIILLEPLERRSASP